MPPKKSKKKINSVTQHMAMIKAKFEELKKVRTKLAGLKSLYIKHNELMSELMPLFIDVQPDQIIVKRELIIGSTKYRFIPFFYDEKKSQILPKVWKSCAHESGTIE